MTDAQEIAAICPTAMVFVAGENGGISHTPASTPTAAPAPTAPTCWPTRSCGWRTSHDRLLEEPDFGTWIGDADPVWATAPQTTQAAFPSLALSQGRSYLMSDYERLAGAL